MGLYVDSKLYLDRHTVGDYSDTHSASLEQHQVLRTQGFGVVGSVGVNLLVVVVTVNCYCYKYLKDALENELSG